MERDRLDPSRNLWIANSVGDLKASTPQVIEGYRDILRTKNEIYKDLEPAVIGLLNLVKRSPLKWNPRIASAEIELLWVSHTKLREATEDPDEITVFDKSGECQLKIPSPENIIRWEIDPTKVNWLRLKNADWELPHDLLLRAEYFLRHTDFFVVDVHTNPVGSNVVDHRREQLQRLASLPRAV